MEAPPATEIQQPQANPELFTPNGEPTPKLIQLGENVKQAAQQVISADEITDIVLVGSQVNGGYNPDSDYDFIIITKNHIKGQLSRLQIVNLLNPDHQVSNFTQLGNVPSARYVDVDFQTSQRFLEKNPSGTQSYSLLQKTWTR